jgi:hypothetical protein
MPRTLQARPRRFRLTRRRLVGSSVGLFVGLAAGWWFWSGPPRLPILRTLTLPGHKGRPLAFSQDGRLLATGLPGGGIHIWEVETGHIRAICTLHEWPRWAIFSPDGRSIAVYSDLIGQTGPEKVTVFDTSDGSKRAGLPVNRSLLLDPRFSSDGKSFQLIACDNSKNAKANAQVQYRSWETTEIRSWETADWTEEPVRPLPVKGAVVSALSPDGHALASVTDEVPSLTHYDLSTEPPRVTPFPDPPLRRGNTYSLVFSLDGQTLAWSRNDGTTTLWDVPAKARRSSFRPRLADYFARIVVFSPDAKTLIAEEMERTDRRDVLWKVRYVFFWAVSRGRYDGSSSEVVVRDLPSGSVRALLKGQYWPVVSPNGKVLATTDGYGTLTLWDLGKK